MKQNNPIERLGNTSMDFVFRTRDVELICQVQIRSPRWQYWWQGLKQKDTDGANKSVNLTFLKDLVRQVSVSQENYYLPYPPQWSTTSGKEIQIPTNPDSLHQLKDPHLADYHIQSTCFPDKLKSSVLGGRPEVCSPNKLFFLRTVWSSPLPIPQVQEETTVSGHRQCN